MHGVDKLDTEDAWGGEDGYGRKRQGGKIGRKRDFGGVNEGVFLHERNCTSFLLSNPPQSKPANIIPSFQFKVFIIIIYYNSFDTKCLTHNRQV